jgi:hypothetical protein
MVQLVERLAQKQAPHKPAAPSTNQGITTGQMGHVLTMSPQADLAYRMLLEAIPPQNPNGYGINPELLKYFEIAKEVDCASIGKVGDKCYVAPSTGRQPIAWAPKSEWQEKRQIVRQRVASGLLIETFLNVP